MNKEHMDEIKQMVDETIKSFLNDGDILHFDIHDVHEGSFILSKAHSTVEMRVSAIKIDYVKSYGVPSPGIVWEIQFEVTDHNKITPFDNNVTIAVINEGSQILEETIEKVDHYKNLIIDDSLMYNIDQLNDIIIEKIKERLEMKHFNGIKKIFKYINE